MPLGTLADFDPVRRPALAVGRDGRGQTVVAHLPGEVGEGDVRLQMEAEVKQRFLFRRAQNQGSWWLWLIDR